jgi:translation elongation factor EF-Ts
MTKENIYQTFLDDPLLVEKRYITEEKKQTLQFVDPTGIKILEVIKLAISGNVDGDTEGVISRKINQFLNS